MNRKLGHLLRASLIAVAVSALWVSSVTGAWALLPSETQLTTDPGDQISPDISGNRIVFQNDREGDWDIYVYDLTTGVEENLTPYWGDQTDPAIDGTRVVYLDSGDPEAPAQSVWCYDIETGLEVIVAEPPLDTTTGGFSKPDISGDKIVYRAPNQNVYCYDVPTDTTTWLSRGSEGRGPVTGAPTINGKRVVYPENYSQVSSVGLSVYDLTTATETHPLRVWSDATAAAWLCGDTIAYRCRPSGYTSRSPDPGEIGVFDGAAINDRRITRAGNPERKLMAAAGDKIVYSDKRAGAWHAFVYDLSTDLESQLTAPGPSLSGAATDGTVVVFSDDRDGDYNIFVRALPKPMISASATAIVAYRGSPTISGTVTGSDGRPLAGRTVRVEAQVLSPYVSWGLAWRMFENHTTVTNAAGQFSLRPRWLMDRTSVARAVVFGDGASDIGASSTVMIVRARTLLGTPKPARSLKRNKTTSVSGAFPGLMPNESRTVGTMQCYRLEKGKWRLRKSFAMTSRWVRVGRSQGRQNYYFANVKLPAGKWRMRARHEDASHALTYSKWLTAKVR